jgi:hypothetical protein
MHVYTQVATGRAFPMEVGDKLVLPKGTVHSAVTGTGCTYIIANGS